MSDPQKGDVMSFGKCGAISGLLQILCVILMYVLDGSTALGMVLTILTSLLILLGVVFSSMSFFRREMPVFWAVIGVSTSVWWMLWVSLAPILRAF